MSGMSAGRSLLQATERRLQELVAESASEGDYDSVLVLTKWASQIASISSEGTSKELPGKKLGSDLLHVPEPQSVLNRQKSNGIAYPRFARAANDLVKIGWSKKSDEEYQHRAPHTSLVSLAKSLQRLGRKGEVVSAHDLMPLEDTATANEIPSYQVYLCLAWLRQEGLVEQQGRQGYTVPNPAGLLKAVEDAWERLETGTCRN